MDVPESPGQPGQVADVTGANGHTANRTPRKKFVGKRTADALAAAKRQQENGTNDSVEDTSIIVHNGKQHTFLRQQMSLTSSSTIKTPPTSAQPDSRRYPRE